MHIRSAEEAIDVMGSGRHITRANSAVCIRTATVSFKDIVDRMEMQTAESSHYLNRGTGECVFVGEENL